MIRIPVEVWVGVPLVSSAIFGLVAPWVSRRLPPRTATWTLSAGSLLMAATTVAVLILVVVSVGGAVPEVAGLGHWSARWMAATEPFDPRTAALAALALVAQMLLLGWAIWHRGRELVAAWVVCRGCAGPLIVIPDREPHAFAVPGWPGRIVVTSGLLEVCTPAERRAVLAHEQSHLDGHHDLHLTAVALAGAVNPLLRRILGATRLATERWADEVAAGAAGDRSVVAAAIGRVAGGRGATGRFLSLAMGVSDVEHRVTALLRRPPRRRPEYAAFLVLLGVVAAVATLVAANDIAQVFHAAMRAAVVTAPIGR